MLEPRPAAFLFDFDGVLVESHAVHRAAWSEAFLEVFGCALGERAVEQVTGRAGSVIASILAHEGGDASLAKPLEQRKLEVLMSSGRLPALLPGARALLKLLCEQRASFGIASNAPGVFVRLCMEQLGLEVPVIFGYEDVPEPKPSPAPYLMLADALSLSDERRASAWIFEDSPVGVRAGVASGMRVCGLTTSRSAQELRAEGAHVTCKNLQDVVEALS